jgi:hypothetical protein
MVSSYITIHPNEIIMKTTFPMISHHLAFINGWYYGPKKEIY